jgi:hypothetical protein
LPPDPDPGGLKRAKMTEKTQPKDIKLGVPVIIIKSSLIGIKWLNIAIFSIKFNNSFVFEKKIVSCIIWIRNRIHMDPHSIFKA